MTSEQDMDAERRRFEDVFRDHYDAVLAYAVARADPETAKDAAAAAFLVAWRHRHELPEQPLPWLLGVTRRTLADQRRSRDRQAALARKLAAQREAVGAECDPAEWAGGDEAVLAALAALRSADQELLTLVAWDGLTNAEIAVVLGCPRVVVGVRLHRARQRFRGALAAIDTDADCTTHANYRSSRTRPAVSVTMEHQ